MAKEIASNKQIDELLQRRLTAEKELADIRAKNQATLAELERLKSLIGQQSADLLAPPSIDHSSRDPEPVDVQESDEAPETESIVAAPVIPSTVASEVAASTQISLTPPNLPQRQRSTPKPRYGTRPLSFMMSTSTHHLVCFCHIYFCANDRRPNKGDARLCRHSCISGDKQASRTVQFRCWPSFNHCSWSYCSIKTCHHEQFSHSARFHH